MKNTIKRFFPICLLLASYQGLAAEQSAADPLPSPYFVDEVHCTGINVPNVHEGWFLTAEEVEPAKKVESANMCERVLRVFGIEKYEWLSPDDLERTATTIQQSGYFQDADLSVQKSEMKNHVHVFLKATPTARFTKSISNDFKMYDGQGQGSPRYYDSLSAEVTDHRFGPVSTSKFGINVKGTSASSPIAASVDSTQLLSDDQQKLLANENYLADLYFKNQGLLTKHFSYDYGIHLDSDNVYADRHVRLNFVFDADFLATKHVNMVSGTVFAGPAFIFASYTPYQVTTTHSSGIFLPGFIFGYDYGKELGNNLKFKMAYYESSQNQSVFQMDMGLQKHLHLLDSYVIAGLNERDVRNAVLPEDRYPLSAPHNEDVFVGLSKIIHASQSIHQVSAVFGNQTLSYSSDLPTYDVNSNYVGLKYKLIDGTWNVNLAASYYFQRVY